MENIIGCFSGFAPFFTNGSYEKAIQMITFLSHINNIKQERKFTTI